MSFIIKGSTTDSEIAAALTPEEILARFDKAKGHANRWDTERDRLRTFIQERMKPGRYGAYILAISAGSPRVYVNKDGNQLIINGVIVDAGLLHKPIRGGLKVVVVTVDEGELLATGVTVANTSLFSKKPPTNITLTEVPSED